MDINKDDYINMENRTFGIMNIFFQYYKELYGRPNNEKIFENIDYSDSRSTNRWMELLYEHKIKYTELGDNIFVSDPEDINIEDHPNIYQLLINNIQVKVSNALLPLLEYLYDNCDWKKTHWQVEVIKSEY